MSNDIKTLADVQPGGRVKLGEALLPCPFCGAPAERIDFGIGSGENEGGSCIACTVCQHSGPIEFGFKENFVSNWNRRALSAQPSPGGQGAHDCLLSTIGDLFLRGWIDDVSGRLIGEAARKDMAAALAARQPVGRSFQAGAAEWMGKCFLPSLYSNMTERGDRLLEEVLELLQAHGYAKARVPTLVDYVFGRPVGDPAQEVGGVMVTLAGYCWVAGLDMHAAGDAELARINQPDVMAKIQAKQEAKNALHFDTPLPGNAGAAVEEWPREGDLVRYGTGASALAIRLGPHAGGWHGYQCCGGYTFFTRAYRPSRADMDTWLDCAKYRDERTKTADNRVAHEMYLVDSEVPGNG
ncbi:hypothetical protein [Stenotrophomonas maltophilia]|uniref:hypothetical protein n=1 Tax=Stenotrophomonas maltophilia TaxID=40324 RepID=UPI001FA74F5A|nr:hypothetical protein [Stenotrophomonas maltophilia]